MTYAPATLSREDQAMRVGSITSTRIAKIAGLSEYGGPCDAYLDIQDLVETLDTKAMRWGRYLQPAIAAARLDDLNAELVAPPYYSLLEIPTLRHPELPWAVSSFDYGVCQGSEVPLWLLEIKAPGIRTAHKWGANGTDDVPMDYLVQCHWEAAIASAALGIDPEFTELVALLGGQDDRVYRIPRDKQFEAQLLEVGARFHHDHIAPRIPPPVDGSDACRRILLEQCPRLADFVQANEEAESWAERLRAARESKKLAESTVKEAENHLLELMDGAKGIDGDGWRCQVVDVAGGWVERFERKPYRKIDFRERKGRN